MIYKVPILGFIRAAVEIVRAQRGYVLCHDAGGPCAAQYEATWVPFDRFIDSFLWTIVPLVIATVFLQMWGVRERRKWRRERRK